MSCPDCSSHKGRTRESGHDSDGRRLRAKECMDCGTRYTTIEVTVPPPGSLYVLSAYRKWRNRMDMRRRRGYHGGLGGQPLRPEPVVDVRVRVRAGTLPQADRRAL